MFLASDLGLVLDEDPRRKHKISEVCGEAKDLDLLETRAMGTQQVRSLV